MLPPLTVGDTIGESLTSRSTLEAPKFNREREKSQERARLYKRAQLQHMTGFAAARTSTYTGSYIDIVEWIDPAKFTDRGK